MNLDKDLVIKDEDELFEVAKEFLWFRYKI